MNLFNYVTVIPNSLSKELINVYLSLPREDTSPALTGYGENKNANLNYRITNWITLPSDIIDNTINSVGGFYNNYLIEKYKQPIKHVEDTQFLYYSIGGQYKQHNDCEDFVEGKLARVTDRDLTILTYLNDDYEGGELELVNFGVKFKPKAGTVIVFPSYIEFTHIVHPVTKGERFTLATWIATPEPIYERPYQSNYGSTNR